MNSELNPSDLRWCISTLGCAEMDLNEVIRLAKQYGIQELELRALEGRLDLPEYFEEKYGSPAALVDLLKQCDIRVTVLDTSLSLIGADEEKREAFLRFVAWAEALGVPYLRVFDGGKWSGSASSKALDEAAETVRWWQGERTRYDWQTDIVIETHDALCSGASCLALQNLLDWPCPILWDAHHTYVKARESVTETWASLKDYIRHIHFKDSVAEANQVNNYTCSLPGTGRFPLQELFCLLRRDGFKGAVCLEWERKWQPMIPPLNEALEALARTQEVST